MEQKEKQEILHLDHRTKLVILILFSIVVMFDVVSGPAYYVRMILTFIPAMLVSIEGRPYIAVRLAVLYALADFLMRFTKNGMGGFLGMMILFFGTIVMQFAPTVITVWYCISTTKVSEFMAAMHRMHVPRGLTISLAVIMRFFPTIGEEYGFIRDAMRMRGIRLGGGKVSRIVAYRMIPLLFSSIAIGDELSAAAVTRGLGKPVKRTNVCEIGFHAGDYLVMGTVLILSVLFFWLSIKSGGAAL